MFLGAPFQVGQYQGAYKVCTFLHKENEHKTMISKFKWSTKNMSCVDNRKLLRAPFVFTMFQIDEEKGCKVILGLGRSLKVCFKNMGLSGFVTPPSQRFI